ncbi:MAG: glutathione S-transferase [Hyphomicrobiaceae bacterium]|nr:glutathione S-transferase [Hyphomicrobiaceae bacterium]
MRYRLVIGNKNISSWSLRPWLALRQSNIPFEELKIELRRRDTQANILAYSPSGRVPTLLVGDLAIWDSLAILEYLAEVHPEARLWPAPQTARALARATCAEMHAGFAALREHCPMDFVARLPMATLPDPVALEVRRILALWRDCRCRHGGAGPFLFGAFSAADAMYALDALWGRRDRYGLHRGPLRSPGHAGVGGSRAPGSCRRAAPRRGPFAKARLTDC